MQINAYLFPKVGKSAINIGNTSFENNERAWECPLKKTIETHPKP